MNVNILKQVKVELSCLPQHGNFHCILNSIRRCLENRCCVNKCPIRAKVVVDNGKITWGDAPLVINPWDEYAVDRPASKRGAGGDVIAVTIGGEAKEALKHAWQWAPVKRS